MVRRPSVCTDSSKAPGDVAGGWLMDAGGDLQVGRLQRSDDLAGRQAGAATLAGSSQTRIE